jgi:hypothetical protein
MNKHLFIVFCLAACDLGPRVADPPDAPRPPDAAPDSLVYKSLLPAGSTVPSTSENPELLLQIRINDGLVDAALMMAGNVVTRGTGRSNGATVRFWNFGVAPTTSDSGIAVLAPLYVFGRVENSVFTPLTDHPRMIDTLPGDTRYSPIRRVINVAVTSKYKGELITSLEALNEALELGLVEDPVADGTWLNMPVVLPGTRLEVAAAPAPPADAIQVFGRGHKVDVFELGTSLGRQPFRAGFMPIGQASGLLSGVATGTPPTKPATANPSLVFQFAIPTQVATFSYSPLAADVQVRLVDGVDASPTAATPIMSDSELFTRNAAGAITAYKSNTVESFTVSTVVSNIQLQFAEGSP